jgi:hypothetical protein
MSFQFKPGVRYRMPVMFGPAPGPRQKPDGTPWTAEETGNANIQWAMLAYRTQPKQLEALLPPGFRLASPTVHVSLAFFRDLYWLAGRGYGVVNVEIPVVYTGKSETVEGGLCLALWEGRPDAITTGREELGFPKLFADIPDERLRPETGRIAGSASWFDFRFFEFEMHGFEEVATEERRLPGAKGTPLFYKYMPRTGPFGSAGSDVAYATTSFPPPGTAGGPSTIKFGDAAFRKWKAAGGQVKWNPATFQQLPTTFHVVNGIAALDILEYVDAEMIEFTAPGVAVATNGHRALVPVE